MVLRGKIKNGKVVLDNRKKLPEGTEVEVRPVKRPKKLGKAKGTKLKVQPKSLAERLKNVIGKAKNLPPDASVNVDHYLYGLPKRQ